MDRAWLAVALLSAVSAFLISWRVMVRRPASPLGILHMLFAALILWRPALLLAGMDDLFPTRFHAERQLHFAANALVLSTIWLMTLNLGYIVSKRFGRALSLPFPRPQGIDRSTLKKVAVVISVIASVSTVGMWSRFGGPSGLIDAVKFQKATGSLISFRALPVVATVLNLSVALESSVSGERDSASKSGATVAFFMLAAWTSALSFTWGARDSSLLFAVVLLFGPVSHEFARGRGWSRVLIGGVTIIASVVALRVLRDVAARDEVARSIADKSIWRQISVAANLTQFDAFVLGVRDAGSAYPFAGMDEFADGARAAVPGLRPEGFDRTAVWFAQNYEPRRRNGWPLTSIGDWYVSIGALGTVVGGFASGLLYRGIDSSYDTARSGADFVVSTFVILSVVQLGVWASMLIVYRAFALPLVLALAAARWMSALTSSAATKRRRRVAADLPHF